MLVFASHCANHRFWKHIVSLILDAELLMDKCNSLETFQKQSTVYYAMLASTLGSYEELQHILAGTQHFDNIAVIYKANFIKLAISRILCHHNQNVRRFRPIYTKQNLSPKLGQKTS